MEELHFLYLCTMHCPIDSKPNNILLEPICKNLLKRSLCVYVNNTEKDISYKEKDKKKYVAKKSIHPGAMVLQTDDCRFCHNHLSRGFDIRAWSVISKNKRRVLCSLYLSLVWMHRLKLNK
uniref:Uncharacterized protein n=1 Tax=Anguilla anguilla TaxID=7936 RepID=A0A0E9WVB8_ANGAN